MSQYSQKNEGMYTCLYDLQKTVQYPVLLKRLYDAGGDGKAWRLIRSWYNRPRCRVRVNGHLSSPQRGILQGSVLSAVLFLLVTDPLLRCLESSGLGPSISNTYAGAFTHADNIPTVTSSLATLQRQLHTVHNFAAENDQVLNPTKCEVLLVSPSKPVSSAPARILVKQSLTGGLGISQPQRP